MPAKVATEKKQVAEARNDQKVVANKTAAKSKSPQKRDKSPVPAKITHEEKKVAPPKGMVKLN